MARASYVRSARAMAHSLDNWPGFATPPWPTFAPPLTALFAGNEIGAENWAMLASLVATCKMSNVNPVDYLATTLRAILDGHPQSGIEDLMPWRFNQPSSMEKRAKVGDARRGGISWRCSDAVNSQRRKGYATCTTIPSPDCPIHRVSRQTR
ncbi:transposase domain-containing protein [Paracoccus alcaliphilus]|uniref:transposase domain-containing protein n=1 Tax=Paracoccus alcaliphilus TaxID=34002 RepID=UPI000B8924AC|nr:transposase domain-containing protein [Paracoccus alcaliphilus]WCR18912.1 transposase domain-containing protein [Paracoccus alcaliphilus]